MRRQGKYLTKHEIIKSAIAKVLMLSQHVLSKIVAPSFPQAYLLSNMIKIWYVFN